MVNINQRPGIPEAVNTDVQKKEESDITYNSSGLLGDGISSSQTLSEEEFEYCVPAPPDGGYGWVICLVSFLNNFILDGIATTFGVFLQEYRSEFNSSVAETSLANGLLFGIYFLVGPIVGALVNKFGFRSVSIVGSVIGSFALLVSAFSPSIIVFQLTYGVLGGVGFGMVYLPASVAVGYYFERKRALATGIAICGSGLGTFSMPLLAKYMLSKMDWKGAHFAFAALMMQVCVFSSLMRPLKVRRRTCKTADRQDLLLIAQTACSRGVMHHSTGVLDSRSRSNHTQRLHSSAFALSSITPKEEVMRNLARPMYKKDIFYSGSIKNIPDLKVKNRTANEHDCQQRFSCLKRLPKPMADILAEMLDPQVLGNRGMIVLCLANLCGIIGYYMALLFTADRAVRYGLTQEQAALLLSILGICNTVGRVLTGAIAYIPKVSALLVNNICMTLAGVTMTLIPVCTTFTSMALAMFAFGLFFSSYFTLWSVIICDLVGLDKLTNGYGLILLVRGVSCLVGPPLGGHLYDSIGDYDATFYMGGACILISTGLFLLLHLNYFKAKGKQLEETQVKGELLP